MMDNETVSEPEVVEKKEEKKEETQTETKMSTTNVCDQARVGVCAKDPIASRRSLPLIAHIQPLTPNIKTISKTPSHGNRKKRQQELEKDLYELWRAVREAKDQDNRLLCSHCLTTKAFSGHRLFGSSSSSDRSTSITPITMETIYNNISMRRYHEMDSLLQDFRRMFSQTLLVFPDPSSDAHRDICILSRLFEDFISSQRATFTHVVAPLSPSPVADSTTIRVPSNNEDLPAPTSTPPLSAPVPSPSSQSMIDDVESKLEPEPKVEHKHEPEVEVEVEAEAEAESEPEHKVEAEAPTNDVVPTTDSSFDLDKEIDNLDINAIPVALPNADQEQTQEETSTEEQQPVIQEPLQEQETQSEQEEQEEEEVDYASMTVVQLKDLLRKRGLSYKGRKVDMVERLKESDKEAKSKTSIEQKPRELATTMTPETLNQDQEQEQEQEQDQEQEQEQEQEDQVVVIARRTPKRETKRSQIAKTKSLDESHIQAQERQPLSTRTNTIGSATPKRTKSDPVLEKTPKKTSRKSITPKPEFTEEQLHSMTVVQLRKILKSKELVSTGRKEDLISRLLQHV